jgi:hypothetical protein
VIENMQLTRVEALIRQLQQQVKAVKQAAASGPATTPLRRPR